jgi:hypothetical protein
MEEESLAVLPVAKGLCSSLTRGGESPCQVATCKACGNISAAQVLLQVTCIEAIASAYGIDRVNFQPWAVETLFSALRHSAFGAEFNHYKWNHRRQSFYRGFKIGHARNLASLTRIGKEHVNIRQCVSQTIVPAILGIIVGVERNGKAGSLQALKQLGDLRLELPL